MNRRTGLETGTEILRDICRLIEGENRYADMEDPKSPSPQYHLFQRGSRSNPEPTGSRTEMLHVIMSGTQEQSKIYRKNSSGSRVLLRGNINHHPTHTQ